MFTLLARVSRPHDRRTRRAPLRAVLVLLLLLTGCGDDDRDDDRGERPSSRPDAGWWQPAPGEAADWDWQLAEPYDTSAPRAMYDLDLFELAPAGSELRYPDGDSVPVPEGRLAGWIDRLHARSPRPVVICYVDTGAYEHYRPDASRFPGYRSDLDQLPSGPDDGAGPPERPRSGSVIGWDTGWSEERWLDIRESSRDAFADLIWARFDLAKRLGCDGVEPDQNNPVGNHPGFPITLEDQLSWYREVAAQAHARGLSVGLKNGHDQPGAAAKLVDHFDWALPEECVEFDECEELLPFIEQGKAVFAVDYVDAVDERAACREHRRLGFDGLVKDEPPTADLRLRCGQD